MRSLKRKAGNTLNTGSAKYLKTAGSNPCLTDCSQKLLGSKQDQSFCLSPNQSANDKLLCDCVCVAMRLGQLDIDWKRLDCVCCVGRADGAGNSPGCAGCCLPAHRHACTPRWRDMKEVLTGQTLPFKNTRELNHINCHDRSSRAFDLLVFEGEGSCGERAVYSVTGKQQGRAPLWEHRRLPGERICTLCCGRGLLGASSVVKEGRIEQWERISAVFPMERRWKSCGLHLSGSWPPSHVNTDMGY